MSKKQSNDPLEFAPPMADPQGWSQAEKEAIKLPGRFREKSKAYTKCTQELKLAREENDRLYGFVVRNLISMVDNCKLAVAAQPSDAETASLASVHRSALHLLEELGVARVDLVGHTYEDVIVDGQKIQDPFEVIESTQKGKASEIKVTEVVADLWVRRRKGEIRVLSRGKVNC